MGSLAKAFNFTMPFVQVPHQPRLASRPVWTKRCCTVSNSLVDRHHSNTASRRDTLVSMTAWPVQLIAANILSTLMHAPSVAGAMTQPSNSQTTVKDPQFYADWPYAAPADLIPYVKDQAAQGDAQAILDAMDRFGDYYPQYKIGPEKGAILEQVLQQLRPHHALEVGTFLGYSAIRTARQLAPGGQLICIEANADNAAVARELISYAGLASSVTVLEGLAYQVIPELTRLVQKQQQQVQQESQFVSFDVVFLDHCKDCYLPDLQALETMGFVHRGSTILADNVLYPGAPGYLEYLNSSGRYKTELLYAQYEYEQAWNPDWEPNKQDAISKSVWS